MQLTESTDNKLAIAALNDIANKEPEHAGEFLRLLRELAPDEEKSYANGAKEVEEQIKKRNPVRQPNCPFQGGFVSFCMGRVAINREVRNVTNTENSDRDRWFARYRSRPCEGLS